MKPICTKIVGMLVPVFYCCSTMMRGSGSMVQAFVKRPVYPKRLAYDFSTSSTTSRPKMVMEALLSHHHLSSDVGWTSTTDRTRKQRSICDFLSIRKMNGSSFSPSSLIFMTSNDDDDDSNNNEDEDKKSVDSLWNVAGLKKETERLTMRCHKKVGKALTRYETAKSTMEELLTNPDVSGEELEQCPNVDALELEWNLLRDRLIQLNELTELLQSIKNSKKPTTLPLPIVELAIQLDVNDQPPKRAPRGPKKKKGPRASEVTSRKPYRKFYSTDNTEIRVGKQASDNDELSCNPVHRDGADWWMHASGCAGSHVVIRSHDENLNEDVIMDAAALAARQSKCSGNVIKVSLTRCRHVSKPRGAKAGLVQLSGPIRTIAVDMKKAEDRLTRLDQTCLIN